jgi:hypothetical protein
MFVAPGQTGSLSSRQSGSPAAGLVSGTERHLMVSRLTRLEDGMFSPVSTSRDTFPHV